MSDHPVEDELRNLREDLARLQRDVAQLVRALVDAGKAEAGSVQNEARDRLRKAAQKLTDATRTGQQGVETVVKQVKDHPLCALAAAFGLGYALGKLFRRG